MKALRYKCSNGQYLVIPFGSHVSSTVPEEVRTQLGTLTDEKVTDYDRATGTSWEREVAEALHSKGWYVYDVKASVEEKMVKSPSY